MSGLTQHPILGSNDPIKEKPLSSLEDKVVESGGGQTEKDMAPVTGSSIHRSGSRPQLDLSKAAIQGTFEERDPTILLPNQSDHLSHLALDIGGIAHQFNSVVFLGIIELQVFTFHCMQLYFATSLSLL